MKKMKLKQLFIMMFMALSFGMYSQGTINGTITDNGQNAPLSGVNIVEKGTNNGVTSEFNGDFTLSVNNDKGTVVVSHIGYTSQSITFILKDGNFNIGTISLLSDMDNLDEVVVKGNGVIDLAEGRKTPVAVSTIKASEIQAKAGSQDLPEILKSTPSVMNIKNGGFGDGTMFLRGFDQTNTAFLLNGQPINGMEDGKMYWSNWSGVLDVADAVQVQRGLGSSKLAISSVGGTVNIVTKSIDKKEGGFLQQMIGNDNYTKSTAYYSTGVNEKGWSFSGLFGYWQGDGYVDNTDGQGQTYFLSVGYQPNDKHTFNFILTGAPQWHAAAGGDKISSFLENGRKYNSFSYNNVESPNTIGNNVYPGGRNVYHKPVSNLTWDWTINDKSSLSTVLYGSLGRGSFAQAITSGDDVAYARGSYNNHNWYGAVSNYTRQIGDNLEFNFGADVRFYNGIHFRGVSEFITVDSVDASSTYSGEYTITDTFGGINPWNLLFNSNNDHKQRFGYDYEENINYYGAFTQLEYSNDKFSAFVQGALSNQDHQKTDYRNYTTAAKSDKVSNIGYNAKAGISYLIADNHKLFGNVGYYSRQPYHDDLFINTRNSNDLLDPAVDNQKITGIEAGYQFGGDMLKVNLNGYYTHWSNRTLVTSNGKVDDTYIGYQTSGVAQLHKGVELEVMSKPFSNLSVNGFVSLGDWKYDGDGSIRAFDNDGNEITKEVVGEDTTLKLDGEKVGGAAQVTAGASANWEFLPRFSVDSNWNWYNDLHSEVGPNPGTITLPSFDTVDAGLSYKMLVGKDKQNSVQFRVNVVNVFDEVYLESVNGSIAASDDPAQNYKGVNIDNNGRFGYGRTWNASLRYNF